MNDAPAHRRVPGGATPTEPDYDVWTTNARAWIGRVGDRVTYAIATDLAVLHADCLEPGRDEVDAIYEILLLLQGHPDLNRVGVDFASNSPGLQAVVADGGIDIDGRRVTWPHVSALPNGTFFHKEPLMVCARQAAEAQAPAPAPAAPVRAATDGARDKLRSRGGYGWVTAHGQYGYGPIPATCALEAELVAIGRLLAGTDAAVPLTVEVDSRAAIKLAAEALRDEDAGTPTTNATATALRDIRRHAGRPVTFTWVKGHNGSPLNEAADQLAKLGRVGEDLYGDRGFVDTLARRYAEQATLATAS